jgi:hypothetical protein
MPRYLGDHPLCRSALPRLDGPRTLRGGALPPVGHAGNRRVDVDRRVPGSGASLASAGSSGLDAVGLAIVMLVDPEDVQTIAESIAQIISDQTLARELSRRVSHRAVSTRERQPRDARWPCITPRRISRSRSERSARHEYRVAAPHPLAGVSILSRSPCSRRYSR